MKSMTIKYALLLASLHLLLAAQAAAQNSQGAQPAAEPTVTPEDADDGAQQDVQPRVPMLQRLFDMQLSLSSVYDSNINHDEDYIRSYGQVPGMGVYFRSSDDDPLFELSYEIARHAYTNTEEWNRVSNRFRGLFTPALDGAWRTETEVEISLKGSSEDRDLSNQYLATQEVEYRLDRANRLKGYGRYRLRRYPDAPDRSANNPQIGLVFERRLLNDRRIELGVRYDENRSDNISRRYKRWTFELEFRTPLLTEEKDQLELEVKYRDKNYERLVEIDDDVEAPRADGQWTLEAKWRYPITRSIGLQLSYAFESRVSNDPDKLYDAHLFDVTFIYALWR